jgi:lipoate---protein ligase
VDPDPPPCLPWRVTPLIEAAPQEQLDAGLALLEALGHDPTPVLRWYRATSTAIVLGRGQQQVPAGTEVEVVTRFSGGGAVLMDPDLLSCDVALPTGHPLLEGDITAVFGRVGRAWADALSGLGVAGLEVYDGPATASRRGTTRQQLLASICYATVGRGEVLARGRKLVGLAQRRRRQGALVQCGLLRRWRPGPLLAALGADPADAEIATAAVGLEELGHGSPDDRSIIDAVSRALTG